VNARNVKAGDAPKRHCHRDGWVLATTATLLFTAAACGWAPPVTYPVAPGVSASFNPAQMTMSLSFAQMFCSILDQEFSGDGWSACAAYLKVSQPPPPTTLTRLPTDWMLLTVGGFGAQCFAPAVVAFGDATEHLLKKHEIKSVVIPVGAFDSSEKNAERIRDKVEEIGTDNPAKAFIAVGHSKGAADWMVALAAYPSELKRVKALITVAGAVGGSWLADDFQDLNDKIIKRLPNPLPSCLPSQRGKRPQNGIDSMRRQNRQDFLATTMPTVPAYSISAVSGKVTMSKVLVPLWTRLRPYALEQDSHIVEREAIVPWGTFLGRALGDHWAVAMPFEKTTPPTAPDLIDQNHYPRSALLEAAVRLVVQQ
jgi:hypothetical protein